MFNKEPSLLFHVTDFLTRSFNLLLKTVTATLKCFHLSFMIRNFFFQLTYSGINISQLRVKRLNSGKNILHLIFIMPDIGLLFLLLALAQIQLFVNFDKSNFSFIPVDYTAILFTNNRRILLFKFDNICRQFFNLLFSLKNPGFLFF